MKTFEDAEKALGSIQQEIESYRKKIGEITKAGQNALDPGAKTATQRDIWEGVDQLYKHLHGVTGALRDQISTIRQAYADHMNGHMPKLTPGQMEKLLKSCGADSDYVIAKPVLSYAKRAVEVSYKK